MKAFVSDECTGCGLCESTCPEVFSVIDDVAVPIEGDIPVDAQDTAMEAKDDCPSEAITIEE